MADIAELQSRLIDKRAELKAAEEARRTSMAKGVVSYSFRNGDDERTVELRSLSDMNAYIKALRSEISELEAVIAAGGRSPSKGFIVGGLW